MSFYSVFTRECMSECKCALLNVESISIRGPGDELNYIYDICVSYHIFNMFDSEQISFQVQTFQN